jgi:hypothetical protein
MDVLLKRIELGLDVLRADAELLEEDERAAHLLESREGLLHPDAVELDVLGELDIENLVVALNDTFHCFDHVILLDHVGRMVALDTLDRLDLSLYGGESVEPLGLLLGANWVRSRNILSTLTTWSVSAGRMRASAAGSDLSSTNSSRRLGSRGCQPGSATMAEGSARLRLVPPSLAKHFKSLRKRIMGHGSWTSREPMRCRPGSTRKHTG